MDAVVLGFVCLGVERIHPDTPEGAGTLTAIGRQELLAVPFGGEKARTQGG